MSWIKPICKPTASRIGTQRTRRIANVQAILASGFAYADSDYYFNSGWVLVVKDNVLITAYQASPRKFVA